MRTPAPNCCSKAPGLGPRLFESLSGSSRELEPLIARGDGAMTLHRTAEQAPLELRVTRFGNIPPGVPSGEELALIWLMDPDYVSSSFAERLRELYGVTPAEARVATALSQSARLADSARELGVGLETIRSHVKSLCRKLGATRMSELLWRLNACVGALIVASEWPSQFNDIT